MLSQGPHSAGGPYTDARTSDHRMPAEGSSEMSLVPVRAASRRPLIVAAGAVVTQMIVGLLTNAAPRVMHFKLISVLTIGLLLTLLQLGVAALVIAWHVRYTKAVRDPLARSYALSVASTQPKASADRRRFFRG